MLRTQSHRCIMTYGKDSKLNGVLLPIYNVHDGFSQVVPEQVYLTICAPGREKGPHLHKERWGYFTCIHGDIQIAVQIGDKIFYEYSGEHYSFRTIEVPPNTPALIRAIGDEDAYVLNVTSPAWTPENPDDHPVLDWNEFRLG